jgi:hypothetical protein
MAEEGSGGVGGVSKQERPSGWQDDPLESAWWLTLFFRVWFFFDRK